MNELEINGVSNASSLWGSILTCIEDAIDERIYRKEGDVVHTDWTEEDWKYYKEDHCCVESAEDFIKMCSPIFGGVKWKKNL